MEAKDWSQIIVAVLMPVLAVWLAFKLSKDEDHRRNLRDLFYSLMKHVDEFQWAIYSLQSHSRNHDSFNRAFQAGKELSKDEQTAKAALAKELNSESVASTLRIRQAISALRADQMMLTSLFHTDLKKPLSDAIDELVEIARPFKVTQEGGRTPEHHQVAMLPIDKTAKMVHSEIGNLWRNKLNSAVVGGD